MSENKNYYYLKFKENYFDQDHIKVVESMQNGHTYSLILIKLYLKSLKFDGQLKINDRIPYYADNIEILAGVLGHDPDHVVKAINLANSLGIIDIFDTGEMFIVDIQNFIGKTSTEADRKKEYRRKLEEKKQIKFIDDNGQIDGHLSGRLSPEIEIDKEIKIDKEIDIKKEKKFIPPTIKDIKDYAKERNITNVDLDFFYQYYTDNNWCDAGGKKVKMWKGKLLTWSKKNKPSKSVDIYEYSEKDKIRME